jgi:elongation factor 1 alpha-like protein
MSRHQAVRKLDYSEVLDEYEGYGYEEEDNANNALSAEDQKAMAEGTTAVRTALGAESTKVTTEQIQEALWYYYFDVDKSVVYLAKKYIAPPPPKVAQKSSEGMNLVLLIPSFLAAMPLDESKWTERIRVELFKSSVWNSGRH